MTYASIQDINSSIMFSGLSNDQLESVIAAVKYARSQLGKQNRYTLKVGDVVKFYNSRVGQSMQGKITKIALKYISVNVGTSIWRVPANMIEAV